MQVRRVAPGWPVPSLLHRRRVMADRITYVGLDVHRESIVVAVAAGGLRGEVREYGRIANTPTALDRLLRKLGGDGMTLRFCYEAGPCGYDIHRRACAAKDRKSTRLNSSHQIISYAVFCLKKKKQRAHRSLLPEH